MAYFGEDVAKLDAALAAIAAIEAREAGIAKLEALRQSGIDRRRYNTLPPAAQRGLLDGGVFPFDPTPQMLAEEFTKAGKRVWTPTEITGLIGDGATRGALVDELAWDREARRAVDEEIAAARAEGRVLPVEPEGKIAPLIHFTPGVSKHQLDPMLLAGLRVKVAEVLTERGPAWAGRAARFAAAARDTVDGKPVYSPARVEQLAKSNRAEDQMEAVLAAQKLGRQGYNGEAVKSAIQSVADKGANPAVKARAYQALAAMTDPSAPADAKPAAPGA